MDFGVSRFRGILFASCVGLASTNLVDLTDTMIAGHLLGEKALSAINLFWPCVEFLFFIGRSIVMFDKLYAVIIVLISRVGEGKLHILQIHHAPEVVSSGGRHDAVGTDLWSCNHSGATTNSAMPWNIGLESDRITGRKDSRETIATIGRSPIKSAHQGLVDPQSHCGISYLNGRCIGKEKSRIGKIDDCSTVGLELGHYHHILLTLIARELDFLLARSKD